MQKPILGPGLCECGCGQVTTVYQRTDHWRSKDHVRGQHRPYAYQHKPTTGPVAFWGHVPDHLPSDVCWPWTGSLNPDGYGRFGGEGVHRVMCARAHGPAPENHHALHSCDNPPCCNPAHLRWGTHTENMDDMVSRGRFTRSKAKITMDIAQEMRSRYAIGDVSQRVLAREFGLSLAQTCRIITGQRWKSVATPDTWERQQVEADTRTSL